MKFIFFILLGFLIFGLNFFGYLGAEQAAGSLIILALVFLLMVATLGIKKVLTKLSNARQQKRKEVTEEQQKEEKRKKEKEDRKGRVRKERQERQTQELRQREEIKQKEEEKARQQEIRKNETKEEAKIRKDKKGYVYIISNVGSFGKDIYKIGVTKGTNPQNRIANLGDAAVPFRFGVHAIIKTDNAYALESELHRKFHNNRVNLGNIKKEFFKVDLMAIKAAVDELTGIDQTFTITANDKDYNKTLLIQERRDKNADKTNFFNYK